MRRTITVLALSGCLLALAALPGAAAERTSPVDELLAGCPPAADLAAIDADLAVSFEADPSAGTLVCTAEGGSRDLTHVQERGYQALRVIRALRFERPLPWTSHSLYGWLNRAIDGVRFRGDIGFSFCCEPEGVINIQTQNLAALQTRRWMEPPRGLFTGMSGLVSLIVHEARHAEGVPHTCGSWDATLDELGAWGVQWYLGLWFAFHSGRFLDAPADSPVASYRMQPLREFAPDTRGWFCSAPRAELEVTGPRRFVSARIGARAGVPFGVANAGPSDAAAVYVWVSSQRSGPIPGTPLARVTPSQGSCVVDGEIALCDLGRLPAGARASVVASLVVPKPAPGRPAAFVAAGVGGTVSEEHFLVTGAGVYASSARACPKAKKRPKRCGRP